MTILPSISLVSILFLFSLFAFHISWLSFARSAPHTHCNGSKCGVFPKCYRSDLNPLVRSSNLACSLPRCLFPSQPWTVPILLAGPCSGPDSWGYSYCDLLVSSFCQLHLSCHTRHFAWAVPAHILIR
ncbi:uncharacterized protein BP01DRAFT_12550 [Aspergillus saccharolyticus JOP 1030-1]|uniref:Uncharacterized protein n=1 Tax=Aspergillus saccharolyticus JOP 1030-1 TaxID=1450539 RepID=A0A318ZR64_9EURO|nr:hypothetical protein BP01DRAFT_12550 [Aspergillus saccharolyticus JOP 1030-1]PYH50016.1 hypothetical protein BP01DRAFT_12550 [Aspergillus saccharolyticus JOP 1030-1]